MYKYAHISQNVLFIKQDQGTMRKKLEKHIIEIKSSADELHSKVDTTEN